MSFVLCGPLVLDLLPLVVPLPPLVGTPLAFPFVPALVGAVPARGASCFELCPLCVPLLVLLLSVSAGAVLSGAGICAEELAGKGDVGGPVFCLGILLCEGGGVKARFGVAVALMVC